ncbi:MAG: divergent polysaccharide deacetylase family protein [Aestuariibacter sp.]
MPFSLFHAPGKFAQLPKADAPYSLILCFFLLFFSPVKGNEITIIIDDMGNSESDYRAFDLPKEVVFSVLPHTPYSSAFSQLAERQNREVMLHMPMEALSQAELGPGGIDSSMTRDIIQQTILRAHRSVPNAIGMNNHMGSKLTQLTFPMQATMEYLAEHRMFFIDSKTTRYSRAEDIARQNGVPVGHRHVFLDHLADRRHIQFQFARLKRIAKKYGFAVGIAHPHDVTIDYLKQQLPQLQDHGLALVTMGDALQPPNQQWVWNQPGQLSR